MPNRPQASGINSSEPPATPEEGYHLTEDLVDELVTGATGFLGRAAGGPVQGPLVVRGPARHDDADHDQAADGEDVEQAQIEIGGDEAKILQLVEQYFNCG